MTASGAGIATIWDPAEPERAVASWDTGHGTVYALAALRDGRIVTGSTDGQIQAWDPARTARPLASIATAHGAIEEVAVLADGRVVTGSGDGHLEIRDPSAFLDQTEARAVAEEWPLAG